MDSYCIYIRTCMRLSSYTLYVGYYSLPVNCLVEPRSSRLLRPAKESRIEELKLAMQANPSIDVAPIVGLVILDEGMLEKY